MPNSESHKKSPFIEYLTALTPENDRGTLAALRRGLGVPPGEEVGMYRYVAPFVPDSERGREREKIYYLVASLYAYHRLSTDEGNFGAHMAKAASLSTDVTATERRFTALLGARLEDLADVLRQAVSFLRSKDVEINWQALFDDLRRWDYPNKPVQRRWANAFWAYRKPAGEEESAGAATVI